MVFCMNNKQQEYLHLPIYNYYILLHLFRLKTLATNVYARVILI